MDLYIGGLLDLSQPIWGIGHDNAPDPGHVEMLRNRLRRAMDESGR